MSGPYEQLARKFTLPCDSCNGTQFVAREKPRLARGQVLDPCPICNGSGVVRPLMAPLDATDLARAIRFDGRGYVFPKEVQQRPRDFVTEAELIALAHRKGWRLNIDYFGVWVWPPISPMHYYRAIADPNDAVSIHKALVQALLQATEATA